ncbi:MAG: hypothetical protein HOP11_09245, partial [Saprospiraceae bacterium]|nr:hypothetical protein [Saprospiraceae bacterium]
MKYKILIFLSILCCQKGIECSAQISQSSLDSLDMYLNQKNYKEYYLHISSICKTIASSPRSSKAIQQLKKYIELELDLRTQENKNYYRHALMHYGKRIAIDQGDYQTALKFYLVANKLVEDPFCLDSMGWFIEHSIATIYHRFNDYNNAQKYYNITLEYLKYHNNPKQICRLYPELAKLYFETRSIIDAKECYLEGIKISKNISYPYGEFINTLGYCSLELEFLNNLNNTFLKRLWVLKDQITSEKSYNEKLSETFRLMSLYELKKLNFKKADSLFSESYCQLLNFYNGNSNRREFAKLFFNYAKSAFWLERNYFADSLLNESIKCLLPSSTSNLTSIKINDLYGENTFYDIFKFKSILLERKFKTTLDTNDIIQSIDYLALSLKTNELLRVNINYDESLLFSISENNYIINRSLGLLNKLQNSKYKFNKAREI